MLFQLADTRNLQSVNSSHAFAIYIDLHAGRASTVYQLVIWLSPQPHSKSSCPGISLCQHIHFRHALRSSRCPSLWQCHANAHRYAVRDNQILNLTEIRVRLVSVECVCECGCACVSENLAQILFDILRWPWRHSLFAIAFGFYFWFLSVALRKCLPAEASVNSCTALSVTYIVTWALL